MREFVLLGFSFCCSLVFSDLGSSPVLPGKALASSLSLSELIISTLF